MNSRCLPAWQFLDKCFPEMPTPKNPARSQQIACPRVWFRDMLWRAFPARSERDLAIRASRALGVSQRQVQNWLRCDHDAKLSHVAAVIVLAGAESAFAIFGGRTP